MPTLWLQHRPPMQSPVDGHPASVVQLAATARHMIGDTPDEGQ